MSWFADPEIWLPVAFAALMGLAIMIYVVLDGYDLGIGLLMPLVSDAEKDRMIASIGPFWDANETWLVLAVGLLLVAFPLAHGHLLKPPHQSLDTLGAVVTALAGILYCPIRQHCVIEGITVKILHQLRHIDPLSTGFSLF